MDMYRFNSQIAPMGEVGLSTVGEEVIYISNKEQETKSKSGKRA